MREFIEQTNDMPLQTSKQKINAGACPINAKLHQALNSLIVLEQFLRPIYMLMERKACSAELSKCLSPEQTQIESHINRLKLMQQSLKLKREKQEVTKLEKPKFGKPSAMQDLDIVQLALGFQCQKLAIYELLHPLLTALDFHTQAELIAQTITDNRNTNTWLRQLVQNVLCPSSSK